MISTTTNNKIKEKQNRQVPLFPQLEPKAAPIQGGLSLNDAIGYTPPPQEIERQPMNLSSIDVPPQPKGLADVVEMIELGRIPKPDAPVYDTEMSDRAKEIAKWNAVGKGFAGLAQAASTATGNDTYKPDGSLESEIIGRLKGVDERYWRDFQRMRDAEIFRDRANTEIGNRETILNFNEKQRQKQLAAEAERDAFDDLREDTFRNEQLRLQRDRMDQQQKNADRDYNIRKTALSQRGTPKDELTPEERRYADYFMQQTGQQLKDQMSSEDFFMMPEAQQKTIADEYRNLRNPNVWNSKDYIKSAAEKGKNLFLDNRRQAGEDKILQGYDTSTPKGKDAATKQLANWYKQDLVARGYTEEDAQDIANADAMIRVSQMEQNPVQQDEDYNLQNPDDKDSYLAQFDNPIAKANAENQWDQAQDIEFENNVEARKIKGLNNDISQLIKEYQIPSTIVNRYTDGVTKENFDDFARDMIDYADRIDKGQRKPPKKLAALRQAGILLRPQYTEENYTFKDAIRENLGEIATKWSTNL